GDGSIVEERRPTEWHLDHVAAGREDFQGRRVIVTEASDGAVRGQVADRASGPVEDGSRPAAHRVEPPAGPGRAVEQNVAAEARRGTLVDGTGSFPPVGAQHPWLGAGRQVGHLPLRVGLAAEHELAGQLAAALGVDRPQPLLAVGTDRDAGTVETAQRTERYHGAVGAQAFELATGDERRHVAAHATEAGRGGDSRVRDLPTVQRYQSKCAGGPVVDHRYQWPGRVCSGSRRARLSARRRGRGGGVGACRRLGRRGSRLAASQQYKGKWKKRGES